MAEEHAGAPAAALQGGMETLDEVIGVLLDIVLPIVLGLAGVFTYSWLGGAVAVSSFIQKTGIGSSIAIHVSPLIPAAIGFGIGGAFWGLGRHKNIVAKAIGKLVGSYFLGLGFGYVLNAAFGNPSPGVLDKLISSTSSAVGGG